MFTIRNKPFPWWMPYLPSNVQEKAEGAGQTLFMPTEPMMQRPKSANLSGKGKSFP